MPVVTAIERQEKRTDWYSIFVDGKYAFSLSDLGLSNANLRVGQELDEGRVRELAEASVYDKLRARAMAQLVRRQRSAAEMRRYLARHSSDSEQIDRVVVWLQERKYLSDEEFASLWVSERQRLHGRSRRRLEMELRQKGVSRETIADTVGGVSDEDEMESIKALARKKLALGRYQDQNRLIKYLIAQGFDYELIRRSLDYLADD